MNDIIVKINIEEDLIDEIEPVLIEVWNDIKVQSWFLDLIKKQISVIFQNYGERPLT